MIQLIDEKSTCKLPMNDLFEKTLIIKNDEEIPIKTGDDLWNFLEENKYFDEKNILNFKQDEFLLKDPKLQLSKLMRKNYIENEHKTIFNLKIQKYHLCLFIQILH